MLLFVVVGNVQKFNWTWKCLPIQTLTESANRRDCWVEAKFTAICWSKFRGFDRRPLDNGPLDKEVCLVDCTGRIVKSLERTWNGPGKTPNRIRLRIPHMQVLFTTWIRQNWLSRQPSPVKQRKTERVPSAILFHHEHCCCWPIVLLTTTWRSAPVHRWLDRLRSQGLFRMCFGKDFLIRFLFRIITASKISTRITVNQTSAVDAHDSRLEAVPYKFPCE